MSFARRPVPTRSSSETDLAELSCRRRSFSLSVNVNEGGRQRRLSSEQYSPTGGSVACQAFLAPGDVLGPDWFDEARRSLEQEVVLAGALHVPAVQIASCVQQFGGMSLEAAPPVQHQLQAALVHATEDEADLIDKAVCLVTPEVFDEEFEPHSAESVITASGRPAATGVSRVAVAAQQGSRSCPASPTAINQLRAQVINEFSQQNRRRKRAMLQIAKTVRDSAKTFYDALLVPEQTGHTVKHGQHMQLQLQQEVQPTQA